MTYFLFSDKIEGGIQFQPNNTFEKQGNKKNVTINVEMMLSSPEVTVSLPYYPGFSKFIVWPAPNSVSFVSNNYFLHLLFDLDQELLWSCL